MTQVKSQNYYKEMKNPPSGFENHKIFDHPLPPKNMAEDIHNGYPDKMYNPPAKLEKAYLTVKSNLIHIILL